MELKIICQCGQKYKFDVEPANGRMPCPVNCPVCNTDGTGTANIMLAHQLAVPPKLGQVSPAPRPPTPIFQPPPPPPPIKATPPPMATLNNDKTAHPAPAQMVAIAPPPPATSGSAPATTATAALVRFVIKVPGEYSLGRGILGAMIGSGVGSGFFYWVYLWAQFRFPLTGCAVGVAAGCLARLLARGTNSTLGAITATIAVLSLAGPFLSMYREFPLTAIISLLVAAGVAYQISSS